MFYFIQLIYFKTFISYLQVQGKEEAKCRRVFILFRSRDLIYGKSIRFCPDKTQQMLYLIEFNLHLGGLLILFELLSSLPHQRLNTKFY